MSAGIDMHCLPNSRCHDGVALPGVVAVASHGELTVRDCHDADEVAGAAVGADNHSLDLTSKVDLDLVVTIGHGHIPVGVAPAWSPKTLRCERSKQ